MQGMITKMEPYLLERISQIQHDLFLFLKVLGGATLLESLLQDESLVGIFESAALNRIEVEAILPIPSGLEEKLLEDSTLVGSRLQKLEGSLKGLSHLLHNTKGFRAKTLYSEAKRLLVLGSPSSTQLKIGVEERESNTFFLVIRSSFNATAAANIFAATLNSNLKRFDAPAAMVLIKLLSVIEDSPILNTIKKLCADYSDDSVLLTKREREKTVLNSKVKYAQSGLNSILNHITLLPESEAMQYSSILESFTTKLVSLAKTSQPALKSVDSIKKSLGVAAVGTTGKANEVKGGT